MRHWELETVAALGAEVDAKQKQVEKLAEAMLRLANQLDDAEETTVAYSPAAAQEIRKIVKGVLGA